MSTLQGNIAQFMEITGLDKVTAENVLRINNYNLERAINNHLESDVEYVGASCSGSSSSNPAPSTAPTTSVDPNSAVSEGASLPEDDEGIRAPIPPKREQLIMPDDDNFRYRKRRAPVFTVCPFRNFAHEAEMQEQQLSWYMENRAAPVRVTRHRIKRSRLDDLFCPPIDILFWGSFQAARDHATMQNRWLIVNLQDNADFKSQVLNRDIWPDQDLKDLILNYFVLWQVSVDNPEGLRFKAFYNVNMLPYVCIIDPRTGEEKLICNVISLQRFRNNLTDFLQHNLYTLEPKKNTTMDPYMCGPSTSRSRSPKPSTATRQSPTPASPSTSSFQTDCDYREMSELSEEDQLELAIKNSLNETRAQISSSMPIIDDNVNLDDTGSDNDQEISDSENEINSAPETYEKYLGDDKDEDSKTKIQLRLPGGERDQLEWPKTTTLRAIQIYINSKYPDIAKDPYKLISAFPRKNILEMNDKLTLEEAKLHPTAVLHFHPDD